MLQPYYKMLVLLADSLTDQEIDTFIDLFDSIVFVTILGLWLHYWFYRNNYGKSLINH